MELKTKIGFLINILATICLLGFIKTGENGLILVGSFFLVLSTFIISVYYDGPTLKEELKNT